MVSACATVGVAWPLHVVFHVIVAMVIACATGCILFAGPLQYLVCLDSTDVSQGESEYAQTSWVSLGNMIGGLVYT